MQRRARTFCTLLLTLTALAMAAAASSAHTRTAGTTRIINGSELAGTLNGSRWEFAVALLYADDSIDYEAQTCGGSRIGTQLILTAAHCVTEVGLQSLHSDPPKVFSAPDSMQILEGTKVLSETTTTSPPGAHLDIEAIYVHPDYDPVTLENDLAIIRTAVPSALATIQVASSSEMTVLGGDGSGNDAGIDADGPWIGGWGDVCHSSGGSAVTDCNPEDFPTVFHEAQVPIAADEDCATGAPFGFLGASMICGSVLDTDTDPAATNGVDTCYGDSGGPLIAADSGSAVPFRLIGITSWGAGCAESTYGVFTRLNTYRHWIASIDNDTGGPGGIMDAATFAAGTPTATSIPLTWTAPSSGPTPLYYTLYVKRAGSLIPAGSTMDLNTPASGLDPATTYTFVLRAATLYGESTGLEVTAKTAADRSSPTRPGKPRLVKRSRRSLVVRWAASTDNDEVYLYRIYARIRGHWKMVGDRAGDEAHRFTYDGLKPGHRYTLRVVARDNSSNLSRPSRSATISTRA